MAGQAAPFWWSSSFSIRCICSECKTALRSFWCWSDVSRVPHTAKVVQALKKERKSDIFEAYTMIYRTIIAVFVLLRINCAPCLSCMHDNQRRPRGKVLMISLPSLHEKWLYRLSAQHSICYENDVRRVLDTAGWGGVGWGGGLVGRPITPWNQTKKVSSRARLHRALAQSRAPLWPRAFNILFYANRVS